MSHDPTPRPSTGWSPAPSDTGSATPPVASPYPAHAPTQPVATPPQPSYAPSAYDRPSAGAGWPGAYPSTGAPPVAGGAQPPTWPPTSSSPFTPPPAPDPAPSRVARRAGRGRGLVAVAAISALLAGAAGGAAGVLVAERDQPSGESAVAQTSPVSTEVPPVSGNSSEPAAAVATALGPAVVQIETGEGLGSGFIYDSSGLILTAFHVINGAETVDVRMAASSA